MAIININWDIYLNGDKDIKNKKEYLKRLHELSKEYKKDYLREIKTFNNYIHKELKDYNYNKSKKIFNDPEFYLKYLDDTFLLNNILVDKEVVRNISNNILRLKKRLKELSKLRKYIKDEINEIVIKLDNRKDREHRRIKYS